MNDKDLMRQMLTQETERTALCIEMRSRIAELESELEDWRFPNKIDEQERELARRGVRIAELESAIDKLAECKGRYHTEANFKALIAVRNK